MADHSLDHSLKQLLTESREALNNSYCPYSKFPVGAALLCFNGTIYKGFQIINCSN
jgi:cytidine deaminase